VAPLAPAITPKERITDMASNAQDMPGKCQSCDVHDAFRYEVPLKGSHQLTLSSNVGAIFYDRLFIENQDQEFYIHQSPIAFSYYLSGHLQAVTSQLSRKNNVRIEPGRAFLTFTPDIVYRRRMFKGEHYRFFTVYIEPEKLFELLDEELGQVPSEFHGILANGAQTQCVLTSQISPHAKMILDQIYNCHYEGALKKLYLESKIIELIIVQLWLFDRSPGNLRKHRLSSVEIERIKYAEEILVKNLDSPPSLGELARCSGLNKSKLRRGFKNVFGTTVFDYYRTYRINKAKKILDEGSLNVDETAHLLGFCDSTHFVKSFKSHFGTTPGTYLKCDQSTDGEESVVSY
jgi:AraC-like DNA-binding protein